MDLLKELLGSASAYKPWIIAPFITMNATLSLIETIQRLFYFQNSEIVGTVSELYIVPIRSTKPLRVTSCELSWTALKRNRKMAVYETSPELTILDGMRLEPCEVLNITSRLVGEDEVRCSYAGKEDLLIRYSDVEGGERISITEADGRDYIEVGIQADEWFSSILERPVKLLFCPETTLAGEWNTTVYRSPDRSPVPTSPLLVLGESSVARISEMAGYEVEMERFRPSIVVDNSLPFEEDWWQVVRIGDEVEIEQSFVNPRCGVINGLAGTYSPKTMNTLFKHGFRDTRNRACLGVRFKVLRPGTIREGDKITLLRKLSERKCGPYQLTNELMVGG